MSDLWSEHPRRRAYVNQRLEAKPDANEQARKPEKRWSISNALRPIESHEKRRRIPLKVLVPHRHNQFFADNGENKVSVRFRQILQFCTELPKPCPQSSPRPNAIRIALTDSRCQRDLPTGSRMRYTADTVRFGEDQQHNR